MERSKKGRWLSKEQLASRKSVTVDEMEQSKGGCQREQLASRMSLEADGAMKKGR